MLSRDYCVPLSLKQRACVSWRTCRRDAGYTHHPADDGGQRLHDRLVGCRLRDDAPWESRGAASLEQVAADTSDIAVDSDVWPSGSMVDSVGR